MIEMNGLQDSGTEQRAAYGTFMIMRSTLLRCNWWKFSIWNGVMGSQAIRIKFKTSSEQVQDKF